MEFAEQCFREDLSERWDQVLDTGKPFDEYDVAIMLVRHPYYQYVIEMTGGEGPKFREWVAAYWEKFKEDWVEPESESESESE